MRSRLTTLVPCALSHSLLLHRPTLELKLEREWQNEWEAHLTKEIVTLVPLPIREWMAAADGTLHTVQRFEMRSRTKGKAGNLTYAYCFKPVPNPYQTLHDVRAARHPLPPHTPLRYLATTRSPRHARAVRRQLTDPFPIQFSDGALTLPHSCSSRKTRRCCARYWGVWTACRDRWRSSTSTAGSR